MFGIQNWKQALGLMALGSVFTIIGLLLSPVSAQRDKFGEIECTKLTVVDANGKPRVLIATDIIGSDYSADTIRVRVIGHGLGAFVSTHGMDGKTGAALAVSHLIGGAVTVYDYDGILAAELKGEKYRRGVRVYGENGKRAAELLAIENLGIVETYGKDGKPMVGLGTGKHGGTVVAYGTDGESIARLGILEHGGTVAALGKDGNLGAVLSLDEHGGSVNAYGKDGKSEAWVGIREHGGFVQVRGKGEGAAAMGVNEYGNGAVSTWDKNGVRR